MFSTLHDLATDHSCFFASFQLVKIEKVCSCPVPARYIEKKKQHNYRSALLGLAVDWAPSKVFM